MNPQEIIAFVAGYLALYYGTQTKQKKDESNKDEKSDVPKIPDEHREELKKFLGTADQLSRGVVSVTVRWLMLNIDKCEVPDIASDVLRVWGARPPSFTEIGMFLKGYFDVTKQNKFSVAHALIVLQELDRCDCGIPMRFQHLYFELSGFVHAAKGKDDDLSVDVEIVKKALEMNQVDFPKLEMPEYLNPLNPQPSESTGKKPKDNVETENKDSPKADEAPKDEAPKDEAPKDEAPKDEAPKDEAPKDEAPKDEAPKDEAPHEEHEKQNGVAKSEVSDVKSEMNTKNKKKHRRAKEERVPVEL